MARDFSVVRQMTQVAARPEPVASVGDTNKSTVVVSSKERA